MFIVKICFISSMLWVALKAQICPTVGRECDRSKGECCSKHGWCGIGTAWCGPGNTMFPLDTADQPTACSNDVDCDDGDPCTKDFCFSNDCRNTRIPCADDFSGIPSRYTTIEYGGKINCNTPITGTRADAKVMVIYEFYHKNWESFDEVILEACESKHDTWLYLFGSDGTKIYDTDDQFACGGQNQCEKAGLPDSYWSGDITVTNAYQVELEYPGQTSISSCGSSGCASPAAISVIRYEKYFFGIGSYESSDPQDCYSNGGCEYTIELLCSTSGEADCLSSAKTENGLREISYNNEYGKYDKYGSQEPNEFIWTISYNSLYVLIAGILILLLITNICCMVLVKRNNKSSNKYKKVVTFSDSDYDPESQQLKQ